MSRGGQRRAERRRGGLGVGRRPTRGSTRRTRRPSSGSLAGSLAAAPTSAGPGRRERPVAFPAVTTASTAPDLTAAAAVVDLAGSVVAAGVRQLTASGGPDAEQVLAYDLAHAAAGVETARSMLDYGAKGDVEATVACAFVADVVHDLITRVAGREALWGVDADSAARRPRPSWPPTATRPSSPRLAGVDSPRHLDADFELVQDTFRRFAEEKIAPVAEHVHRTNGDVPEEIIAGLGEMGAFGLSVPEQYGGWAGGGEHDYLGMVVATEELSRGSLGIGGSLITRPEILTRALVKGGTEEQKQEWLPKLATAEVMAAVAVTEPDFGSDVAGLKVTATPAEGPDGEAGYVINGVKTWCTFGARADVLMLLARTDPDRAEGPPRPVAVRRAQGARRRPRLRAGPGRRRAHGGPAHRHPRLPRHALLRGRLRRLVGAGGQPHRRRGGPRPRLLPPDGGVRERPAADRGPRPRRDAGGLRGGPRLRRRPQGVRPARRRLPAHPGEAGPHGHHHPGRPPVRLRRGPA